LSPYLDLTRPGDPGVNYYLGTIPELDRRRNTVQFRNAIRDLEVRQNLLATEEAEDFRTGLPSTGHAAVFNNTAGYFNNGAPPLGNLPQRQRQQVPTPKRSK
jgi:hypothetical protein